MKILFAELSEEKRIGGLDAVCLGLQEALAELGIEVVRSDGEGFDRIEDFDLVHIHGLWSLSFVKLVKECQRLNKSYIISPHGMLEPWALKHKGLKKKLALFLYQKKILEGAVFIHATAESEAENLKNLGLRNRIEVVANGIEFPDLSLLNDFKSKGNNSKKTLLFLSRIQKKKGLLNLVSAWAKIQDKNWQIRIAGPEEEGHLEEVKQAANEANVLDDFLFEGPLYGDDKWSAYAQADIFVLPTYSENFGLVVPEALICGTPVITTKGTPWSDLVKYDCGWWIDVEVDALARSLSEAMSLNEGQRDEMGQRGIDYVSQHYSWSVIAGEFCQLYRALSL